MPSKPFVELLIKKIPVKSERMHNYRLFYFTLLFLFTFLAHQVDLFAQSSNQIFRHITPSDGLCNSFVWKIMQDKHGFIWVAGNGGLDKLDGVNIINYRYNALDEHSIPRGQVRDVLETGSGHFWVAAYKLAIMDVGKGVFKTVTFPDSIPAFEYGFSIVQDDNGDIWAGALTGLYHLPFQDFMADTLVVNYYAVQNVDFESVAIRSIVKGNDNILWVGSRAGLYQFDMQTRSFNKPGPFDDSVDEVLTGDIWDLLIDRNQNLWISSLTGLAKWHDGEDMPEHIVSLDEGKVSLRNQPIQAITEDQEGYIWVGSGYLGAFGINQDHGELKRFRNEPGNPKSIAEDDVHYALKDQDGNMWFGYHKSGITLTYEESWNYTYGLPMKNFSIRHPVNEVFKVIEEPSGDMWFGTSGGLVLHTADGSAPKNFMPFPADTARTSYSNQITDLVWFDNNIIGVTTKGKILLFDIQKKQFSEVALPVEVSRFWDIVEDEHRFYVGPLDSGMFVINKDGLEVKYFSNPYNDTTIGKNKLMAPLCDIEGNIWVLYLDFNIMDNWEVFHFDPDEEKFVDTGILAPKGITYIGPPAISSTQPGLIWHSSDIGIIRQDLLNKQVSLLFQAEMASVGTNLFGLAEDSKGMLYVSGQDGIRKFDPNTGFYYFFQGNEGYRPLSYIFPQILSNGDLFIGGTGGYVRFNPDEMIDRGTIRDIYITEVGIGNEKYSHLYDKRDIPGLTYANNSISFSYIALNYKDPGFTKYRYKIRGYQDEWVEVGKQQQLFFTNFSPGEYVFQLQAATRSQGYSDQIAEFVFRVLPPWWKTNLAYFFYALFIVAGVFTFDRIQRSRIISRERERSREKELESAREIEKAYKELKATQTQLIHSEKMASLGELTAGIAHEIQNPLNFVNNFSELSIDLIGEMDEEIASENYDEVKAINQDIKSNLEKINFHGKRASSIVNGMLAHSRTGSGQKELTDINALADEYLRLSYHGLRAKDKSFNAKFEAHLDETLPKVKVMGQDIGRVLLNLINNAFYAVSEKYKKGVPGYEPNVTVTTRKLEKHIQIRIKDNGDGIPERIKNKIFQPFFTTKPTGQGTGLGLSLSYDIITKGHDGSLEVETQEGLGTEFIITLPIIINL